MRYAAVAVKQTTPYLTFSVADEEYAIHALRVQEILASMPLTRVPRAPRFMIGVLNLRGNVIPVIDLRVKLGLSETTITPRTCIVIVDVESEQGATSMALLADEVKQVMDLADEEILAPPTFGTRIDLSFLFGMGDLGDRFALILNVDKVLTTLELIAASQAAAETSSTTPVAAEEKRSSRRKSRPSKSTGEQ